MKKEKIKKILKISCAALLTAGIVVMLAVDFKLTSDARESVPDAAKNPDRSTVYDDGNIFTGKTVIDTTVIKSRLNDVGFLETQEYYYTETVDFSKGGFLDLSICSTEYIASYDGKIIAGVDFEKIDIEADAAGKKVTVKVPKAVVRSNEIYEDSCKVYLEKNGLWNPTKVDDYNKSLTELKINAQDKAIANGMLDKADANAKILIGNFIKCLPELEDYEVVFA